MPSQLEELEETVDHLIKHVELSFARQAIRAVIVAQLDEPGD